MHTGFKYVLRRSLWQPGTPFAPLLAPAGVVETRRHIARIRSRRRQDHDAHCEPLVASRWPDLPCRSLRLPGLATIASVEAWTRRLEPFLPPHLGKLPRPIQEISALDAEGPHRAKAVAWILAQSRSHVDILSYLAIQERRWDTVKWLVKTVVGIEIPVEERLEDVTRFSAVSWDSCHRSLHDATALPIAAQRAVLGASPKKTLLELTNVQASSEDGIHYRNDALGIILRSLGNMILTAAGDRLQEKHEIMGRVLEILACLHHAGVIPRPVYHYEPYNDPGSLRQPPLLSLLSSQIFTALSDASWKAHERDEAPGQRANAQYSILGQEVPRSRYRVRTPELGSEVWLELVLWSCLHGGWAVDGMAILRRLTNPKNNSSWTALHWRNHFHAPSESHSHGLALADLWSFASARGAQADSPERLNVDKTISCELIAAYIDNLLSTIRVCRNGRYEDNNCIFDDISSLKRFLDRGNLGLGSATWGSVVARFLESGGVDADNEARWLEMLLYFNSPFNREHEYGNALWQHGSSPSYILEPASISLSMLHRALRIYISNESISGAARIIARLQALADENKTLSIKRFFETFNRPASRHFTAGALLNDLNLVDYPGYFPEIPPPLLADLLSLSTRARAYDFARGLLYSEQIDGPLIPPELYSHHRISAAITEYALVTEDVGLLARATERGIIEASQTLLDVQIRRSRWNNVEKVIGYMAIYQKGGWVANLGAAMASQLLILQHRTIARNEFVDEKHPVTIATSIFRTLIQARPGEGEKEHSNRVHGILCVLSSVGSPWRDFCSRLFVYADVKSLEQCVNEADFAQLLQGVSESQGARSGMALMRKWCLDVSEIIDTRGKRGQPSGPKIEEVSVESADGSAFILRGKRLLPTISLMRTVYQAAFRQIDRDEAYAWHKQGVDLVLSWALKGLRAMSLSENEIGYELHGIRTVRDLHLRERAARVKRSRPSRRPGRAIADRLSNIQRT